MRVAAVVKDSSQSYQGIRLNGAECHYPESRIPVQQIIDSSVLTGGGVNGAPDVEALNDLVNIVVEDAKFVLKPCFGVSLICH